MSARGTAARRFFLGFGLDLDLAGGGKRRDLGGGGLAGAFGHFGAAGVFVGLALGLRNLALVIGLALRVVLGFFPLASASA